MDIPGLPKKEYIRAGLYSIDYKMSQNEAYDFKRQKIEDEYRLTRHGLHKLVANDAGESASLEIFPLPMHFGNWYLNEQQSDFMLPYDIAFLYERKLLQDKRAPPPFTKIRSSMFGDTRVFILIDSDIFVERNRRHDSQPAECHCIPPADGGPGCGDDCINRFALYLFFY